MDIKKTAQTLLDLADKIEKEASDCSVFVCPSCMHAATLTEINSQRVKFASETDPEMTVQSVTINDKVACPHCDDAMSYVATDESQKYYYVEAKEEGALAEEGTPAEAPAEEAPADKPAKKEEAAPKGEEDIDIDALFEDVETQGKKEKEKKEPKAPEEEKPAEEPKAEEPKAEEGVTEEVVPEEPKEEAKKEEPKKEKKDKADDEEANTEKKEPPKFKSKEATERYQASISRYSM